ncbi:MAG TPA: LytTR family DNA-binding domain-containing protein [Flavipsychrobacter sp.]|nr:LytTR family DNA-binding domain-containing protein [Flavipsychrobacter sp.]
MEEKIRAIIIDDEENCILNLKYFLSEFCPGIEVVAVGDTIKSAIEIFNTQQFDIAFLDIEVFNNNIFNAIETGNKNFKIVFVTAHEQYAIRALKAEAIDYILKPLSPHDIIECYSRIKKHLQEKAFKEASSDKVSIKQNEAERKLVLKDGSHVFVVKMDDIYYMQAKGAYTLTAFSIDDTQKLITISKSLNQMERENNNPRLYRVHKSFMINVQKIKQIIRNDGLFIQMRNDDVIPVAKRRAPDFLSFLNKAN